MKIYFLVFFITLSQITQSACPEATNYSFIDSHEKPSCSCSCMKQSFPDELQAELPKLNDKLNKAVHGIIETKVEILVGNMSKLDSYMQVEDSPLPEIKSCSSDTLENELKCPDLEKMLLAKGYKSSKKDISLKDMFIGEIRNKFSQLQSIKSENSINSCSSVSEDGLNYVIGKKALTDETTLQALEEADEITNQEQLKHFREANYSILSKIPFLYSTFNNLDSFKIFFSKFKQNKQNLETTIKSLVKDNQFKHQLALNLESQCKKTFKEISEIICKEIALPNNDSNDFFKIVKERKALRNSFFPQSNGKESGNSKEQENDSQEFLMQGSTCYTKSSPTSLPILPLFQDIKGYFSDQDEIEPNVLKKSISNSLAKEKEHLCQLSDYDCPGKQCSAIRESLGPDDNGIACSKHRNPKLNFPDLFTSLCVGPTPQCTAGKDICNSNSPLALYKEYEENLKRLEIISTIATTTTKKDELTGKETTTTTYETVRRVSSFAKSFHGDSKPAGTTLSIPTAKENVTVQVTNAKGQDITREVAPEVATRQAERPQQFQPQAIRTGPVANSPSEYRTEMRKVTTPTIEPIEPTNRISDASYRTQIDDIRKKMQELKEEAEKQRLQDKINDPEAQRRKSVVAAPVATPKSIDPVVAPITTPTNTSPTRSSAKNYAKTTGEQSDSPNEDITNPVNNTPAQNTTPTTPATPQKTPTVAAKSATASGKKGEKVKGSDQAPSTDPVATVDQAEGNLKPVKEFSVTTEDDISISKILKGDPEILSGEGKAFSIYKIINGKKIWIEFQPTKVGRDKTLRFRPVFLGESKKFFKLSTNDNLLVKNLGEALKSI